MILTKLERKNKIVSEKQHHTIIIISMIILNNNYETIMSLCRKVQIVLQINSQSRKKLLKNIVEKIDIYCTNMFLLARTPINHRYHRSDQQHIMSKYTVGPSTDVRDVW